MSKNPTEGDDVLRRMLTPRTPREDRPDKDGSLAPDPCEADDHAGPPPPARTAASGRRHEDLAEEDAVLVRLAELTAALNDPRAAALALFAASESETEPCPGTALRPTATPAHRATATYGGGPHRMRFDSPPRIFPSAATLGHTRRTSAA